MKAVALLLLFVVLATLPSETSGWGWKRAFRKFKDGNRKVGSAIKKYVNIIRNGRAVHADMTDEEVVEALATRDINELFEVEQLSDADKAGLNNIQLEARD